jgi:FkbM family methyltransferase
MILESADLERADRKLELMNIRLMQLIGLRRLMPRKLRVSLRGYWDRALTLEQQLRERQFYRQFVRRDDLVFDIGANRGDKTAAFLSLGAHVVAVEPNAACADYMKTNFHAAVANGHLEIECVAIASEGGELNFTVFDSTSAMTSGSTQFVKYAKTLGCTEVRAIRAKAITLDDLVARHGLPHFVKIDVEGMDADVLRGLARRPKFLSFEYHTAKPLWENTCQSFQQVIRLGFKEANLTSLAAPKLLFKSWMTIDAALSTIKKFQESAGSWGDVIVR